MNKTTMHVSATINPARASFVKLGFGGSREKENIEKGILRFGYSETPFEAATLGKWDVVREVWRGLRSDAGAATRPTRNVLDIFEHRGTVKKRTFTYVSGEPGRFGSTIEGKRVSQDSNCV